MDVYENSLRMHNIICKFFNSYIVIILLKNIYTKYKGRFLCLRKNLVYLVSYLLLDNNIIDIYSSIEGIM